MNKNRFYTLFVLLALAVTAALTFSQIAATEHLVSAASAEKTSANSLCSSPDVDHSSIHTVFDAQRGAWVTYAGNAPTGMEGGLIQLLDDRRYCSK